VKTYVQIRLNVVVKIAKWGWGYAKSFVGMGTYRHGGRAGMGTFFFRSRGRGGDWDDDNGDIICPRAALYSRSVHSFDSKQLLLTYVCLLSMADGRFFIIFMPHEPASIHLYRLYRCPLVRAPWDQSLLRPSASSSGSPCIDVHVLLHPWCCR